MTACTYSLRYGVMLESALAVDVVRYRPRESCVSRYSYCKPHSIPHYKMSGSLCEALRSCQL